MSNTAEAVPVAPRQAAIAPPPRSLADLPMFAETPQQAAAGFRALLLQREVNNLRAAIAELLAAARAAEEVLARQKWVDDSPDPEAAALRALRAAIARLGGLA